MPFSRLASRCRSIGWQRLISQWVCALYKQQMQNYGHMMLSVAPKHFFLKRNCMFEFCSMFPNKYIYFRLNQCVNFIHPHLPYWWSYELISILFAFIIWYNTFCGLSWYVQLMFYDVICTKLNQLHAVITVHVHLQQLFGGCPWKGTLLITLWYLPMGKINNMSLTRNRNLHSHIIIWWLPHQSFKDVVCRSH